MRQEEPTTTSRKHGLNFPNVEWLVALLTIAIVVVMAAMLRVVGA